MAGLEKISNWVGGSIRFPLKLRWLDKVNPHTGERIAKVADSGAEDVELAIGVAAQAFLSWSILPPVERGKILSSLAVAMKGEIS